MTASFQLYVYASFLFFPIWMKLFKVKQLLNLRKMYFMEAVLNTELIVLFMVCVSNNTSYMVLSNLHIQGERN